MVKVAVPLLSVPVPSEDVPSRKVTVPLASEGVTVAVRVTVWPVKTGLGDADSDVVVSIPRTVRVTVLDVLVANVLFAAYTAVTLCVPGVRLEVVKVATPLLSVPVPSEVVPSWNVTVPVTVAGVAAGGVTVAVKVTV